MRSVVESIRSIVSGVMNDSKRLAPDMMKYLALARSNAGTVPNVAEYARLTDARQSVGCLTILGEPNESPRFLKNVSWKLSVEDQSDPCGPYLSLTPNSLFAVES